LFCSLFENCTYFYLTAARRGNILATGKSRFEVGSTKIAATIGSNGQNKAILLD